MASLGRIAQCRFVWTEARSAMDDGRPERAGTIFREVLPTFLQTGRGLDAAIIPVVLALALLAQGREEEAQAAAHDCRKCLIHLPESSAAVAVVEAVWRQAERRRISRSFLARAAGRLEALRGGGTVARHPLKDRKS